MNQIMNHAPIRKRVFAALIDYVILYICIICYTVAFGEQTEENGFNVTGYKSLFVPLFWFLYFPLAEGLTNQTLGKKIIKLSVQRVSGSSITIGLAFVRRLFDAIDFFFFGLVGILVAKSSENSQRVGDLVAQTVVVIESEVICEHCHTPVELSGYEKSKGQFICPECGEQSYT